MPVGAVLSEGSSGEAVSHFAAIRIKVYGRGILRLYVFSNDSLRSKVLFPYTMFPVNRIPLNRLVNFVESRACFELRTLGLNEKFRVHRIIIFSKEIYTGYPG